MQPSEYEMIPIERAMAIIQDHTPLLDIEWAALDQAMGQVIAEDVVATEDLPPYPVSTMDGYAVVAKDASSSRRITAEITAGQVPKLAVRPGTAARVMTGAPLPPGADAVVMVEYACEANGYVTIRRPVRPGENVQHTGQDVGAGQQVLHRGSLVGPAEIGLLASLGKSAVLVHRRPRVAVLATGDELVEPTAILQPGAVRNSNGPSLLAAVQQCGCIPVSMGIARDIEGEQERIITAALSEADVILTTGGVSVGSRDLIKPILARLGDVHFGRVAVKPGKPLTFATVGPIMVFGLPGNPVSTLVTFEVFVRPALLSMQGQHPATRPSVVAYLDHEVTPSPDRPEYQRAILRWREGRFLARTTGLQASSRLLSMIGANALVLIPPGQRILLAGSTVQALLTGDIVIEH